MEPDRAGIGTFRGGPPLAGLEHRGLVVLLDPAIAGLTHIMCGLGLPLVPAQPLELEPLHVLAVRARHEVAALVRCLVFALDPGNPLDRRRRRKERLAPPREGARACFGQRNRIALLVGRRRIGIDLVQKQIARRHRAQSHRAVGAGDDQQPRRELLRQHRVAGVAGAGRLDPLPQRRALGNQRFDALP